MVVFSPELAGASACPDVLPEWPYYGSVINTQRKARLNCMREFTEQKAVLPSGLWGRVCLRYV